MRQEIRAPGLAPPVGHYADAVRFGKLLFLSGLAPLDENHQLVGGDDPAAQAAQVFSNMGKVLEAAGLGAKDVLKVTVFLTHVEDAALIGPVRRRFFGETRPASTLVGVAQLMVPGMRVEVEAVAGFPDAS